MDGQEGEHRKYNVGERQKYIRKLEKHTHAEKTYAEENPFLDEQRNAIPELGNFHTHTMAKAGKTHARKYIGTH